jgi:hypothetical protein
MKYSRSVLKSLVTVKLIPSLLITRHPDDERDMFLRNVGSYKSYMSEHPRRRHSS